MLNLKVKAFAHASSNACLIMNPPNILLNRFLCSGWHIIRFFSLASSNQTEFSGFILKQSINWRKKTVFRNHLALNDICLWSTVFMKKSWTSSCSSSFGICLKSVSWDIWYLLKNIQDFILSSLGSGPGQVNFRWGSDRSELGLSQVNLMTMTKILWHGPDLSYTIFSIFTTHPSPVTLFLALMGSWQCQMDFIMDGMTKVWSGGIGHQGWLKGGHQEGLQDVLQGGHEVVLQGVLKLSDELS